MALNNEQLHQLRIAQDAAKRNAAAAQQLADSINALAASTVESMDQYRKFMELLNSTLKKMESIQNADSPEDFVKRFANMVIEEHGTE